MEDKTQVAQDAPASFPRLPAAAAAHWSSYLEGPDLTFFPAPTAHLEGSPQITSVAREFGVQKPQNNNLSTLLRSSWAVVGGAYSGSKDVIFGSKVGTAGASVVVPTRVRWAPETTVRDLVDSVQKQDDDNAHFEPVEVDAIAHASEDAAAACQFTCVFDVEEDGRQGGDDWMDSNQRGGALTLFFQCSYLPNSRTEDYENEISNHGDGPFLHRLRVMARFDQRTLSKEQAQRMMEQFERVVLLLSDSNNREQAVASLPLLSEADRAVIDRWNARKPTVVRELAHERVRRQVSQRPNHMAVNAWDGRMTYAELDDASDRLALRLRQLGVGPEVMVPLSFEKSLWAVVAMLGVLKAGGAFAVLDPAHPQERKEAIARQLDASVAVASASAASLMPPGCVGTILICDDTVRSWPSDDDAALPLLPPAGLGPDNAMYIIFTSGSTGTPKGCVTEHGAFCSSMFEFARDSGMHSERQVLQFASYSFDTSLEEIFCALMAGATLHVPSEESRINDLAGELQRTRTDWAELNPKVASLLVPEEVPTLQTIILGGDRSHGSDVSRWPNTTVLMNSYGCTEASVTSTLIPLNRRNAHEEPPIGKGVGCRLWIVDPDDHHRLAPIGAPGELLIEGPGLARGYLGDAERTANSFIVDPRWALAPDNGGDTDIIDVRRGVGGRDGPRRFYKTGDIVRYNDEGAVRYIGRKDTQIKLRGQRVELGEIEHQLSRALPDCRVAAEVPMMQSLVHVEADAAGPSQATLAAFIVLPAEAAQDGQDVPSPATATIDLDPATVDRLLAMRPKLVEDLTQSLPRYMVPSIFIPISAMPLTVSAKTDRRKLRALAQALRPDQIATLQGRDEDSAESNGGGEEHAGLWTDAERQMQAAWAEILGVPPNSISRRDNFFRVGGDSLAGMKLVPLCRKRGLQISVADVFRAPELHSLTAVATGQNESGRGGIEEGEAEQALDVAPFSLLGLGSDSPSVETLRREAADQCGLRSPGDIEDLYPCTPLQEGLLALSSKQPGSYVARLAFELSEDVDLAGFHAAWDQVVESHSILRTTIVSLATTNRHNAGSSTLMQAVTKQRLTWETATDLDTYLQRDQARLVEIGAPMTRFAIIPHHQYYHGRYIFVWTLHHCIYDGWSFPFILRDVTRAYNRRRRGQFAELPLVPPFNRFIHYLSRQDQALATDFWSRYLEGSTSMFPPAPQALEEPSQPDMTLTAKTEFPIRAMAGTTPATVLRTAWALLTRSYTGTSDVVFGTTVTGRNAPVPGVEEMSGPTIATVPVRVSWKEKGSDNDTATTLRELLSKVQTQAAEMMPFEQTGLQHIARASEDAQAACQFQTLFVVQPADDDVDYEDEGDGTKEGRLMRPLGDNSPVVGERVRETTQALLVECTFGQTADAPVDIHMSYDSHRVPPAQAVSLLARFQHILAQLVSLAKEEEEAGLAGGKTRSPLESPITQLSLVSAHDRAKMKEWNEVNSIAPARKTLQDLITEATSAYPGRPAISAWDGDMSFTELATAVSRVARRLGQMQIGTGVGQRTSGGDGNVILLSFERSRWAIVSMLAVLQSGAAFVALDPSQPDERLLSIMQLSGARVLLTSRGLSDRLERLSHGLGAASSLRIACTSELMADDGDALAGNAAALASVTPRPSDLAYMIFTSGSTGVPKGVMIEHGAAAASVVAHGAAFGVTNASRTLQFSSLTFDACIFEIFTTLSAGGCVCMPSDAQRVNDLAGAINALRINTVMLTPSVLALLAPEDIPAVQSIIFIAEQVTDNDIKRWRGDGRRLLNGYGPTECTVVCVVNRDLQHGGCIGKAVGCHAWIVDADDHDILLPVGAVGELLIESPSLARGYLKDPERTAASFITNPAWAATAPGEAPRRFYKTGDLVRPTSEEDGSYMYLGRKDTQVKLRGQRIELSEVDYHLQVALPAGAEVRSEIVKLPPQAKASGGSSGSDVAALAAFVVLPGCEATVGEAGASSSSIDEFREVTQAAAATLTKTVPSYMVPSLFVPVPQMPLTVSGKTDRMRLRTIASRLSAQDLEALRWGRRQDQRGAKADASGSSQANEGSNNDIKKAPCTDNERRMRSVWAKVLQLGDEDIGVEDNFFRLGGDSISAMKLVAAARAQGIEITVAKIFQTPVLNELCGSGNKPAANPTPTRPVAERVDVVQHRQHHNHADHDVIAPFELLPGAADAKGRLREDAAKQCGVSPDAIEDLYPCTPLQQGLISLTAKEGSDSYVFRQVFRLGSVGTTSTLALRRAWEQTVRAHPILRTRMVHLQLGAGNETPEDTTTGTGSLYQAVLSPGQAQIWRQADITKTTTLSKYLAAEEKEGDTIGELGSPLCRIALVAEDTGNSNDGAHGVTMTLVWTIHHAIYDGWTIPILKEAVAAAYEAAVAGSNTTTYEVAPSPPFSRFIQHLGQMDIDAARSFWSTYLNGAMASPFPATPTARADGLSKSYQASSVIEASYRLWSGDEASRGNSRTSDVTMSTLLRSAYSLVVGAHTGSQDVVFGTTLSGRNAPIEDIEDITGPTIATVPLRVRWEPTTTARELLHAVQQQAAEMIPYEQFGLQRIASLDNGGAGAEACRFQSLFVVQPAPEPDSEACSRLFGDQHELHPQHKHHKEQQQQDQEEEPAAAQTYALGIEASVLSDGELQLTATFDNSVLDDVQTRRILSQLAHVARLLHQNSSNNSPESSLAQLDLLGPEDTKQIVSWNNNNNVRAVREPMHELIGRHAVARPSAAAVSAWDGDLTYRELDYLSNGLAHRLRACGVGIGSAGKAVATGAEHLEGSIVAFSLDKSKWVPVTMLAILKAGGAFVALDPAQPSSRLQFIAKEAGVRVLVTTHSSAGINEDVQAANTLFPSDMVFGPNEMMQPPSTLPRTDGSNPGDALAYVIFTSGSTGVPKGVLLPHVAAASSLLAHGPAMGITPTSRVLQFAAYTFDACVLELLGTLLIGACVCIPSRDECTADLNAAVRRYNVTFVALTPRVASLLDPDSLPAITAVALGAETVHPADIRRWGSSRRVSNGYGPTECAVVCVLESRDHRPGRIGRGVGAVCWVADPEDVNRLAPVGAPGELIIEGPCLARGYLRQDDKTAASFIEDPAWTRNMPRPAFGTTGQRRRFYMTGDLVRYDSDGALIFMGRKDTQVKLRGLRIELGEVEHHLRRLLPAYNIAADVVTLPQRKSDSQAVVAFVALGDRGTGSKEEQGATAAAAAATKGAAAPVPVLDKDESARQLVASWADKSAELAQVLPSYMVPTLLVPVSKLPLTPSGKTDRRVLHAIAAGLTVEDLERLQNAQVSKEPPRTVSEKLMHMAWVKVLGVEPSKVGIHDSFFHLGGESILAMRLVPVAAELGFKSLRVSDIFRTPVLADLCARLPEPEHQPELELELQQPGETAGTGAQDQVPAISQSLSPAADPSQSPLSSLEGSGSSEITRQMGLRASSRNSSNSSSSTKVSTPNSLAPFKTLTPLTEDDTYKISFSIDISNGASSLGQSRVAPATDFQALAYEYSHLRRRGFVNYFIFRLRTPVGLGRVHAAAKILLQRYSILRTSLKIANGRLWQVIAPPADAQPCIEIYRAPVTGDNSGVNDDTLPVRIVEMDEARRLGARREEPVKFFVAQPSGSSASDPVSYMVLRLAHTHYDGLSFPRVLDTLANSLSGQQETGASLLAPELSFSDFSLTIQVLPSSRSLAYWRGLLAGSKLTPVLTPSAVAANEGDEGLLTRDIPMPDLGDAASAGLTFPAVLKAAWAVVLSQHTRATDLVFGCMVSGRMPVVPGVDAVVGPCVNIVPVRVKVDPNTTTTRELMGDVHAQHVDSMEHEHIGMRRILSQCTDWPSRASFGGASVVQHQAGVMNQSLAELSEAAGGSLPFDLGAQGRNANAAAIWVITTPSPTNDGVLGVELYYARHAVPIHVAQALMQGLCVAIQVIGRNWDRDSPLPRTVVECEHDAPILPCGDGEDNSLEKGHGVPPVAAAAHPNPSPSQLKNSIVGEAWTRLLKAHPNARVVDPALLGGSCSMFDLWYDNLVAVELMGIYEDLGVYLDLEQLLRSPTMSAQLHLLRDWC